MFNKARTLEVTEFTSESVRDVKKGARPKKETVTPAWSAVTVDPIRVADELVKTIHGAELPKHSDRKLAKMEATASSQRLTASKGSKKTDNLRLRESMVGHVNGLRDFSKSTRIGEYGQAICSIFVQDKLSYPMVMDFDFACSLAGAPKLSKKAARPDFVGWNGVSFCLVESKASLGSDLIKALLRKGLLQCDAGRNHLKKIKFKPAARYCVLTIFQMETASEDSCIKFADPEDSPSVPEWAHRKISAGYYKNALQAKGWVGPETDPFDQKIYTQQRAIEGLGGRTFSLVLETEVPTWLEELKLPIQKEGMTYSLYLDNQILGALRSGDGGRYQREMTAFKEVVSRANGSLDVVYGPNQQSIVQVFGDGLVMVLRNDGQVGAI